jgi:type IV pilus assembly protein PilC
MPMFTYKAIDPATSRVSEGLLEAANLRKAKEQIRNMGQIPTAIEEKAKSTLSILGQIPVVGDLLQPGLGLKQLTIFTEQLATLLDAGIPLIEALYMLEQQTVNPRVQEVMHKIRGDIIAGDSFSVSMKRFPREFPELYTSLIEAGEVSGELDKICFRLADLYTKMLALQRRIVAAMVYPAITLVVITGVCAVILIFVVPIFKTLFASKGADLPLPTQVLVAMLPAFGGQAWALLLLQGFGLILCVKARPNLFAMWPCCVFPLLARCF